MINLAFQPAADEWGLEAHDGPARFTFSGYFSKKKIDAENAAEAFARIRKISLWAILVLGLAALVLEGMTAWPASSYQFIAGRSPLLLIFWVSILCDLYLWATVRSARAAEEALNLFDFDGLHAGNKPQAAIDVYELLNAGARRAWRRTFSIASGGGRAEPASFDLFLALLENQGVRTVFFRLGVDYRDVDTLVRNYLRLNPYEAGQELRRVPFLALAEAVKLHNKTVDPLMLLCALVAELPEDHLIRNILFNLDVDFEKLEIICAWIFTVKILSDDLRAFRKLSRFKPDRGVNQGMTSVPTPYLDRYSQDLTMLAKYGQLPAAWGRAADLQDLYALLAQGSRNVIVKGAAGTGRTTLINELAYKMAAEQVPAQLQDQRLVRLELSGILGTPGKAENVFLHCLEEALRSGNIVIVIEEIHELGKITGGQGLTLLELLVNFLEQSPLSVIGTSTLEDDVDYLQKTANLGQVFGSFELHELSRAAALLACCVRASFLEFQYGCYFQYPAIEQAVSLSDVYLKGEGQPQRAIAVLAEAARRAKMSADKYKVISAGAVQKIVSEKAHVPAESLGENEAQKLLGLESELQKFVVGQVQAVRAVSEALRRARSGLASAARPLASFLFLGPTGVGKTELAKTLAAVYFGEEKYLLRLDMSEFRGPDGLAKLLGAESARLDTPLIKHLKNYPFCLLLLDEFEKASPEVWNIFLQILEDGRLTTAKGETLDLTHAMVIATSNAGTRDIQEGLRSGQALDQIQNQLFNNILTGIFPPELLNRFDGIVLFTPLSQPEVKQIALLQLQHLASQLKDKGIKIGFTENVVSDIAAKAFDPLLGARPIRRYIQDHLESFVAKMILSKKLSRGSEITIDIKDGELAIK